jgi:hypothetical protein
VTERKPYTNVPRELSENGKLASDAPWPGPDGG